MGIGDQYRVFQYNHFDPPLLLLHNRTDYSGCTVDTKIKVQVMDVQ